MYLFKTNGLPTIYLKRNSTDYDPKAEWHWPKDNLEDDKVELDEKPHFDKRGSKQKWPPQEESNAPRTSTFKEPEQKETKTKVEDKGEAKEDNKQEDKKVVKNDGKEEEISVEETGSKPLTQTEDTQPSKSILQDEGETVSS